MLDGYRIVGFAPTRDYARARKFYEGTLGLEFVSQDPFALVMRAGGNRIRIAMTKDFVPQPFTVLGWESPRMDEDVAALARRGVVFERYPYFEQDPNGVWTSPGGTKVAWFKDPDGNLLSLSSRATG